MIGTNKKSALLQERSAILTAMRRSGWILGRAAYDLECPESSLRSALRRHPAIAKEYARRCPGPGQPRKVPQNA